jgi:formylglycine-generating enzyme required for sulfatase activity
VSGKWDWLRVACGYEGNAQEYWQLARELHKEGDMANAATAYDRAFALQPSHAEISQERQSLLTQLALVEHGIRFRYIPAGSFIMGTEDGDQDELPVHAVELDDFWLAETPVSWAGYCYLMDWEMPPASCPKNYEKKTKDGELDPIFFLHEANKIRLQYCEDATLHARDWHAHAPSVGWKNMSTGKVMSSQDLFGVPPRQDSTLPWQYNQKPMVCVSWQESLELCEKISMPAALYSLPSEAEWEKAARGGLIQCRYAWGNERPDAGRCDFSSFDRFAILPMRQLPPNTYGLYGMCGGVWEWTADWYDACYYHDSPRLNPTGPTQGEEKVLRGGSWSDCAEAVTVSFRSSRRATSWQAGCWGEHMTPNIGFRLCRTSRLPPGVTAT